MLVDLRASDATDQVVVYQDEGEWFLWLPLISLATPDFSGYP